MIPLENRTKTIAIIGGGISGIVTCKESLATGVLLPTVFEKSEGFGGIWNNDPKYGRTWTSVRTNISKYSCMFSDFPHGNYVKEGQDFLDTDQVHQYLQEYIDHFNLFDHFKFQTLVTSARYIDNEAKWSITYSNVKTGESKTENFDFLIVASGVHTVPSKEELQGVDLETFKKDGGKILHSVSYKSSENLKDNRVLVVGNSNSGCDIVNDLCKQNTATYHYFKRPYWIIPRYLNVGKTLPIDSVIFNRSSQAQSLARTPLERNKYDNAFFSSQIPLQVKLESVRISEDQHVEYHPVCISDTYLENLKESKFKAITSKEPNLHQIITNEKIDTIVLSHGFNCDLSYLSDDVLSTIKFQPDNYQVVILYKECIPPRSIKQMGFVGLYKGTYFPSIELQARMITMMFVGQLPYPSDEEMEKGLKEEEDIRYAEPKRMFPHVDYVDFTDGIARVVGALPDMKQLETTNPELYQKIYLAPHNAASYRLVGPHSNPEQAEKMINHFIADINSRK
ncbi:hypothetical protein DLAC_05812 [Tieghemostelium lacteum]|uniref:Flavin-containing monooxygenase n=1 Tax=Tieghemostelium lacteum TaxID=361077 RepID=A0A151ZGY3_TIELA|nr:hypothetical protein DLAC_05812 [Tieghemostelium lacteum]|eukprot:KYQ93177.1 hypothetical protein DLAC_05812 [Tieghemostelium lacteum]